MSCLEGCENPNLDSPIKDQNTERKVQKMEPFSQPPSLISSSSDVVALFAPFSALLCGMAELGFGRSRGTLIEGGGMEEEQWLVIVLAM